MNCDIVETLNNEQIELLAHYTSFESAIKIITSGKLMYHGFKEMNDIGESYIPFVYSHFNTIDVNDEMIDQAKKELERYQLISFCQDDNKHNRCFAIPSMWGHYGIKGFGACLVYFKSKVKSIAKSDSAIPLPVKYRKVLNPNSLVDSCSIPIHTSEIRSKIKEWFFIKTRDWKSEQEYRVVKKIGEDISEKQYLEVGSALVCIIICKDESIEYGGTARGGLKYRIMKAIAPDGVPVLVFENQIISREWGLFDGDGNIVLWPKFHNTISEIDI